MFREVLFPLRCGALGDWIQNSLTPAETLLIIVFEKAEHDKKQECRGVDQPLDPQRAIECAILNRFAYVIG